MCVTKYIWFYSNKLTAKKIEQEVTDKLNELVDVAEENKNIILDIFIKYNFSINADLNTDSVLNFLFGFIPRINTFAFID